MRRQRPFARAFRDIHGVDWNSPHVIEMEARGRIWISVEDEPLPRLPAWKGNMPERIALTFTALFGMGLVAIGFAVVGVIAWAFLSVLLGWN